MHPSAIRWRRCALALCLASMPAIFLVPQLSAHPLTANSRITCTDAPPTPGPHDIANLTGAPFDAANVGGSGTNADGPPHNGASNDDFTLVARDRPAQGQTFTTGDAPEGYDFSAFTLQIAGYPENVATGDNRTFWDLNFSNGPFLVRISRVEGSELKILSIQNFMPGSEGNPGAGGSAAGAGTWMTFHLPYTVHLEPGTTYAVDITPGNDSRAFFEWNGTREDACTGGTAYVRRDDSFEPVGGDRVFIAALRPAARRSLARPGTLHNRDDLRRMAERVAAGDEPWATGFQLLLESPYASTDWQPRPVETIIRGIAGSNYTRSQQDAQAIYSLALLWHITGETQYADHAVTIANAWARTLRGVDGNSNLSLGAGICGYLFAVAGDLLSPYPGWAEADRQAYCDMMMRVFYPANHDLLWRHHDTFWRSGGNTHYRLNWDTCNMLSMAAIGVLCDNRAVYEQAVDYFKTGPGNGRVERAAWYLHPSGLAQTEEMGRDQGHNLFGWHAMAMLCELAWHQGDDLYAYDNYRVLRALESITKYNLGHDVEFVPHRNTTLTGTETLADQDRGRLGMFHEMVYNHFVNERGIAAPWNEEAARRVRPERWPDTRNHPSEVDWFGLGTLTFTREPSPPAAPGGLLAFWTDDRISLSWIGTAGATGYTIGRATAPTGPFETVGEAGPMNLSFVDEGRTGLGPYYYVVTARTPDGPLASGPLEVRRGLMTHYPFDGDARDAAGSADARLRGGSTGLPVFAVGRIGSALVFDGSDDYVEMPVGIANYQDLTIAAWVWWEGGANWQRIFDIGSEIEKSLFLTPSTGSAMRFSITTSRGQEGTGILEGPPLPAGRWVHVAVTLGGDIGHLYVDGHEVDTAVIDAVDPLFAQVFCYLGRSMYNSDPLFRGKMDDFRIYNVALTVEEVANLATNSHR